MATKDEALKMSINKWQNNFADERHNNQAETFYWFNQYKMAYAELLNACKEALEQPAQEPPVAHIKQGMDGYPKLVFNGTFQYDSIAAKQPDIALYIKEQL